MLNIISDALDILDKTLHFKEVPGEEAFFSGLGWRKFHFHGVSLYFFEVH
jgi:hypothetical protein